MTDFSFYFLITRVLKPFTGTPGASSPVEKSDEVARELAEKIGPLWIQGSALKFFSN